MNRPPLYDIFGSPKIMGFVLLGILIVVIIISVLDYFFGLI